MSSRYQNIPNSTYYKTILYNPIEPKTDDIYVITVQGDRLDNIAYEYYGDSTLWWIIAASNNIPQDSIFLLPGTQLRIPTNISIFLNQLENLNNSR
jgi:hypothetical protein